jgi:hypothetical protein
LKVEALRAAQHSSEHRSRAREHTRRQNTRTRKRAVLCTHARARLRPQSRPVLFEVEALLRDDDREQLFL